MEEKETYAKAGDKKRLQLREKSGGCEYSLEKALIKEKIRRCRMVEKVKKANEKGFDIFR